MHLLNVTSLNLFHFWCLTAVAELRLFQRSETSQSPPGTVESHHRFCA